MDNLTPEQRHKNMQAIKSKNSKIEVILRQALWKRGLRYRKNTKQVYGHPDIAFIGKRIAVFCDGEFWHGYEWESRRGNIKSNKEFWFSKIERNMKRDSEVNDYLTSHGWVVLRFWESEIKNDTANCVNIIEKEYYKNE